MFLLHGVALVVPAESTLGAPRVLDFIFLLSLYHDIFDEADLSGCGFRYIDVGMKARGLLLLAGWFLALHTNGGMEGIMSQYR